jgi:hypothetical protein
MLGKDERSSKADEHADFARCPSLAEAVEALAAEIRGREGLRVVA